MFYVFSSLVTVDCCKHRIYTRDTTIQWKIQENAILVETPDTLRDSALRLEAEEVALVVLEIASTVEKVGI